MIVNSSIFDLILFGALLLGAVFDERLPALWGTASLLAVGTATYIAAQELCHALARRGATNPAPAEQEAARLDALPQQESLAIALSLSLAGFIYYWRVNDSDLSLLVLSIGLMMASLMVAIAVLSSVTSAVKLQSPVPVINLLLVAAMSLLLGALAGLWVLGPFWVKAAVTLVGLVVWKLRESSAAVIPVPAGAAPEQSDAATLKVSHPGARWALVPQSGTLLDRLVPMLVLGALLFMAARQGVLSSLWHSAPAATTAHPQQP